MGVLERSVGVTVFSWSAVVTLLLLVRSASSPAPPCDLLGERSWSRAPNDASARVDTAPGAAPVPVATPAGLPPGAVPIPPQCLLVERVASGREAGLTSPMQSALRRCRDGAVVSCLGVAQAFQEVDPALSTEARARGCLGGDLGACALLGHQVVEGLGVPADVDGGIAILRATCAATPKECFYLTLHLQRVEPEEALAAATRGCHAAQAIQCLQAGELAEQGVAGASVTEAAAWFDTACELGDRMGCAGLLTLAASGRIPTTPESLETLRRRACAVGVHDACEVAP